MIERLTVRLVKVEPGGEFPLHRDPYSHLFYIVKGSCEAHLGEDVYRLKSGHIAFVKAGEIHGYINNAEENTFLLSMNIHED